MRLSEPPRQVEDTQPHSGAPTKSAWVSGELLVVIVSMAVMLSLSLIGVALYRPVPAPQPIAYAVALHHAGEIRPFHTEAQTVGAALAEQGVALSPADVVRPPLESSVYEGLAIHINPARAVTLTINDVQRSLQTLLTNPYDILQAERVVLGPADEIWLDGTPATPDDLITWPVPVNEIVVRQPIPITIHDGEITHTLTTTARTVGDALFAADIPLYLADRVQPHAGAPLRAHLSIIIQRALPIVIAVDGRQIESRAQGPTVGDAIAESGIVLAALDYALPPESEPITPDMRIQVVRVSEDIVSMDAPIPHETRYQADADLPLDQRRTLQQGQDGLERITARVRYADGTEIAREPLNVVVMREPLPHIIGYGTQIVLQTIDTPDGPREYWRKLRVYATSYHPAALGGDNSTATGDLLQKGIIGADPDLIPYGTQLYIPDYGVGVMADTGAKRADPYWIDLGYSDDDYVSWHWPVDIYWLAPVPESIDYLLPGP